MKKLLYFAMALGLVACQTENVDVNGGKGDAETSFISVRLVTTPTTRASYDTQEGYEDGSAAENEVTSVRFYFFDSGKNATVVRDNASYYDLTEISENGKNSPNVEKILEATLLVETGEGHKVPSYLVAVLNPPQELKDANITKVSDLTNYAENLKYVATSNFLMSNAVYANGSNVFDAVDVNGHLYSSAAAALGDPVTIYVERVLAKVSLKIDMPIAKTIDGVNLYKTSQDGKYEFGEKEIYVKFFGWNVTTQTKKSRAMKSINAWDANLFDTAGEVWTYPTFFRSFWAVNPSLTYGPDGTEGVDYFWGPFGDPTEETNDPTAACYNKTADGSVYVYVQENASDDLNGGSNPKHPTQVILAGQLVDENGVAVPFANYAFEDMPITSLPGKYASVSNIYIYKYVAGDPNPHQFERINEDFIQLKTAMDVKEADQNTPGRYYVYAQLADDYEKYLNGGILVIGNSQPEAQITTPATTDDINEELLKLSHAKVWTSGYTYYYFDIRHLANPTITVTKPTNPESATYEEDMKKYEDAVKEAQDTPGYYGIVRNHVYKTVVTGLKGLGTPVFDPSEVIYPEKPVDDEDSFLAAEIKILSWRIVNHSYELDWE